MNEYETKLTSDFFKLRAQYDELMGMAERLFENLDEAIDLVEDAYDGQYDIDSFTTQSWKAARTQWSEFKGKLK